MTYSRATAAMLFQSVCLVNSSHRIGCALLSETPAQCG